LSVTAVRWGAVALLLCMVGACSDDDEGGSEAQPVLTTASTVPTPTIEGDGTAFCDAMLGVGRVEGAAGATAEEVLVANEELVSHLDEAQTNTPSDAPADFEALLDDYRLATEAITEADGDVAEAFDALERDHPEVVARLGSASSHAEAYAFLVERCGDAALPGEG
jgi:hypothetical protein